MFKPWIATALLVSSLSAGAGPDRSVTLTTAAMYALVSTPGVFLLCNAANVSTAPITVTLELVGPNANVTNTDVQTLQPWQQTSIFGNVSSPSLCRVSFQGTAASVRASLCHWQGGGCISNVEAR